MDKLTIRKLANDDRITSSSPLIYRQSKALAKRLEAAETINHNQKLIIELAAERLEESEANAALNRAMEVTERERADKAEVFIKDIGAVKSRTFKSANSVPVGLPENELWVKHSDLQALIKEHGHG